MKSVSGFKSIIILSFLLFLQKPVFATTNVWTAGAATSTWSTSGNWSLNHAPTYDENVVIADVIPSPVLPNTSITINALTLDSGSTLTHGGSSCALTVTNNLNIKQDATLDMESEDLTVGGKTYITGNLIMTGGGSKIFAEILINSEGSFQLGTSTIYISDAFTNNGTFTHGNGSIHFNGTTPQTLSGLADITFYNISVDSGSVLSLGKHVTINNNLSIDEGTLADGGYTITLKGNITNTGTHSGAGKIQFYGTSAQTISGTGGIYGNLDLNNSYGASFNNSSTITGSLTITNGTLTAPTGTLTLSGNFINNGSFVNNSGTLSFNGTSTITLSSATTFKNLYISGTLTAPSSNLNISGNFTNSGTFVPNGGTITFTSTSSILGSSATTFNNLTITGTLTAASGNINIKGNFTNDGTFTHNNGTITFNGTTAQTIGGTSSNSFYNLTLNNAAGFSNVSPAFVSHTLTLTEGILFNEDSNLITMGPGSNVYPVGGTATSFINGVIAKTGSTSFVFPVGDHLTRGRIAMGTPTSYSTFAAGYVAEIFENTTSMATTPAPALRKVSQLEYWGIERLAGTGNVTINLYWENASVSKITDCGTNDLRVARWNGTAWENADDHVTVSGSCSGTSSGSVATNSTVNEYGIFTFGSKRGINALPVTLIYFTGECVNYKAELKWATASEVNNNFFTVERSADGVNWNILTTVLGHGTTSDMNSYNFTDVNSSEAFPYYRLKQTDYDGKYEYFNIISMKGCEKEKESTVDHLISIYPNPSSGIFTISSSGNLDEFKSVEVFNSMGQKVYASTDASKVIDLSAETHGLYFVNLKTSYKTTTRKLIIK